MTYSEEDMQRPVSGGFTRAELEALPADVAREVLLGRITKADHERKEQRLSEAMGFTTPVSDSQDPYAVTAWGSNEYDFTVPSGQRCRLRNLDEQMLLEAGILDQVTRLPGIVMTGPVAAGQGKPPAKPEADMMALLKDPTKLKDLMGVMNTLVSVVVVLPKVRVEPVTEEKPLLPGEVKVSDINLGDRVAIMERAMGGITKLDAFRPGSESTE